MAGTWDLLRRAAGVTFNDCLAKIQCATNRARPGPCRRDSRTRRDESVRRGHLRARANRAPFSSRPSRSALGSPLAFFSAASLRLKAFSNASRDAARNEARANRNCRTRRAAGFSSLPARNQRSEFFQRQRPDAGALGFIRRVRIGASGDESFEFGEICRQRFRHDVRRRVFLFQPVRQINFQPVPFFRAIVPAQCPHE